MVTIGRRNQIDKSRGTSDGVSTMTQEGGATEGDW